MLNSGEHKECTHTCIERERQRETEREREFSERFTNKNASKSHYNI